MLSIPYDLLHFIEILSRKQLQGYSPHMISDPLLCSIYSLWHISFLLGQKFKDKNIKHLYGSSTGGKYFIWNAEYVNTVGITFPVSSHCLYVSAFNTALYQVCPLLSADGFPISHQFPHPNYDFPSSFFLLLSSCIFQEFPDFSTVHCSQFLST